MNYSALCKLAPVLLTMSLMTLSGCELNDDKEVSVDVRPDGVPNPAAFQSGTHARFNPAIRDMPFNSDLIFASAADSDGTANVGPSDNAVTAALNQLDGFSNSAYFDVLFEGSLNPASALPMQTVFLIALDTDGKDALDPANIVGVDQENMPSFSVSVASLDGGENNVIRIHPEAPLKDKTKYLVFVTNDLLDAEGEPVTRSFSYNFIRDPYTNISEQLVPVRDAITGWETIAAGVLTQGSEDPEVLAAAKDKVVVSYSFTTTDPFTPLIAMASPRAAVASQIIQSSVAAGMDQTEATTQAIQTVTSSAMQAMLPTPQARDFSILSATGTDLNVLSGGALGADVGNLFTGWIRLPAYSPTPQAAGDFSFLSDNWRPDQDLGTALGGTVPSDLDGSYNVTYRFPYARQQTLESVPLQLTLPEADVVPSFGGGATCGQIQASQGNPGYPLVIYVHGITSDRSSVIALAHSLAGACVATVAIDLPLHGIPATSALSGALNMERGALAAVYADENGPIARERHFEVVQGPTGAPQAMNFDNPTTGLDGSGTLFINLSHLPASRDNLRQAVMDLLNLNATLGDLKSHLGSAGFDGSLNLDQVYLVGISLGGIIGTTFATVNEMAIANDAQLQLPASLNSLKGVVVSTGGSQIVSVLRGSGAFGPRIDAGLAAAGITSGTTNYERFMYTAQSTVASGDPVNFAARLAALDVPVLVQQIVGGGNAGDGGNYTTDKVVPNTVTGAPLAGTTGLANLLGATQRGAGAVNATTTNALVNLTIGHHASLLRPNENDGQAALNGELLATAELQTEVVSFVLSGGAQAAVGSAPSGTNAVAPFIQAP